MNFIPNEKLEKVEFNEQNLTENQFTITTDGSINNFNQQEEVMNQANCLLINLFKNLKEDKHKINVTMNNIPKYSQNIDFVKRHEFELSTR